MTKKIAISESIARSFDKSILAPSITSPDIKSLGGTILMQPLERIKPSSELKASLEAILSDVKVEFGALFTRIPMVYLISQSKAKNNAVWLGREGSQKPILVISQMEDPGLKNVKYYTYIDLSNGQVVHADTPEKAKEVEDGLRQARSKAAKDVSKFISAANEIAQLSKNLELNERMESIMQGNVTNLYSSLPMLKKCLEIINSRISRQEGMVANFESKLEELKDDSKEAPGKVIYNKLIQQIEREIENPVNIKDEIDLWQALQILYRGISSRAKMDADVRSGKFNKIKEKLSISDERFAKIIDASKRILSSIDKDEEAKREKNKSYLHQRKERSEAPGQISSDSPIFGQLPSLEESDFAQKLPGGFEGHQSLDHYINSFKAKIRNISETKIKELKAMREGVLKIINNFETQMKTNKKISVCNFSQADLQSLAEARNESFALIKSYYTGILTKEGKYNKTKIGSIFENTVEDMMMSRYVALTIRYIEMVFTKSGCTNKK